METGVGWRHRARGKVRPVPAFHAKAKQALADLEKVVLPSDWKANFAMAGSAAEYRRCMQEILEWIVFDGAQMTLEKRLQDALAAKAPQSTIDTLAGEMKTLGVTKLVLRKSAELSDLSLLAGLTSLRELDLRGCVNVADLSPLAGLTSLERLNLKGCAKIEDITLLRGLKGLKKLDLAGAGAAGAEQLEELRAAAFP